MKTKWIEVMIIVMALGLLSLCFGVWDNTKPADSDGIYGWPTSIRANWDALEAVFGVDLADAATDSNEVTVVNVKSYDGAVGDGVADDTAAIQAALDALVAAGGGELYFPPGNYLVSAITKTIARADGVIFQGAGQSATILTATAANPIVTLTSSADCQFRGMTFSGNGKTAHGVKLIKCSYVTFDHCLFTDCDRCIYMNGSLVCLINECYLEQSNYGYYADINVSYPNLNKITSGAIRSNSSWGIYQDDGRELVISGVQIESNGTAADVTTGGIKLLNMGGGGSGGPSATISNCWFEGTLGKADIWAVDCAIASPVIIRDTHSGSALAGVADSLYLDTCLIHLDNFENIAHHSAIETVSCYGFVLFCRVHDSTINADVFQWPITKIIGGTPRYVTYDMHSNFLKVQDTIDIGTDGVHEGVLTMWDGAGGNTPPYVKIASPDGTVWYLFIEDDGTLKYHNGVPTVNADGDAVGDQTD